MQDAFVCVCGGGFGCVKGFVHVYAQDACQCLSLSAVHVGRHVCAYVYMHKIFVRMCNMWRVGCVWGVHVSMYKTHLGTCVCYIPTSSGRSACSFAGINPHTFLWGDRPALYPCCTGDEADLS